MMALHADNRMWWAAGAAMLLHGALLTNAQQGPSHTGHGDQSRSLSMVTQRWTLLPPKQATEASSPDAHRLTSAPTASVEPEPPAATPAPTATNTATTAVTDPDNTIHYWPRQALDQGPYPLAPVVIPYPEDRVERDTVRGVLALSIDQHGTVRHVDPQDDRLPALMVRAARDAFLQARFQAGQRQGQSVASRIVIEVQFDPTERPSQRGVAAPGL